MIRDIPQVTHLPKQNSIDICRDFLTFQHEHSMPQRDHIVKVSYPWYETPIRAREGVDRLISQIPSNSRTMAHLSLVLTDISAPPKVLSLNLENARKRIAHLSRSTFGGYFSAFGKFNPNFFRSIAGALDEYCETLGITAPPNSLKPEDYSAWLSQTVSLPGREKRNGKNFYTPTWSTLLFTDLFADIPNTQFFASFHTDNHRNYTAETKELLVRESESINDEEVLLNTRSLVFLTDTRDDLFYRAPVIATKQVRAINLSSKKSTTFTRKKLNEEEAKKLADDLVQKLQLS